MIKLIQALYNLAFRLKERKLEQIDIASEASDKMEERAIARNAKVQEALTEKVLEVFAIEVK